jgi:Zn-dependent peptidase ImmA (M78 family)/DNA-binding XRE family transcriptional regulator
MCLVVHLHVGHTAAFSGPSPGRPVLPEQVHRAPAMGQTWDERFPNPGERRYLRPVRQGCLGASSRRRRKGRAACWPSSLLADKPESRMRLGLGQWPLGSGAQGRLWRIGLLACWPTSLKAECAWAGASGQWARGFMAATGGKACQAGGHTAFSIDRTNDAVEPISSFGETCGLFRPLHVYVGRIMLYVCQHNAPMSHIFAERLKALRMRSGMSLDNLAEASGGVVSKQAIHRYEKGEMMPSSTVLLALAKALNTTLDDLFRETEVSLAEVNYRRKASLGVKRRKHIESHIIGVLERYAELELLTGKPKDFVNPLKGHSVNSGEEVEEAALAVRKAWGLGLDPIQNVLELMEEQGCKVIEVDPEEAAFDGLSAWSNGQPVVGINKEFPSDRKRFTALHELAHLMLHLDGEGEERKTNEGLCNRFAGAMLIPADSLRQEFAGERKHISIRELELLKVQWGVSVQALLYRAKDVGLIDDGLFQDANRYLRSTGRYRNEGVAAPQQERAVRFDQLLYYGISEGLISYSKAAQLKGVSLDEIHREVERIL